MTSRSGVLGVQLAGWGRVGKGVQGVADGVFFCISVLSHVYAVHVSTSNATFLPQVGVSFI